MNNMNNMNTYTVISYELWGNPEEGFQVNDMHRTDIKVDIDLDDTDEQIIERLVEAGIVFTKPNTGDIEISGEMEYTLYLADLDGGYRPMFELQRDA